MSPWRPGSRTLISMTESDGLGSVPLYFYLKEKREKKKKKRICFSLKCNVFSIFPALCQAVDECLCCPHGQEPSTAGRAVIAEHSAAAPRAQQSSQGSRAAPRISCSVKQDQPQPREGRRELFSSPFHLSHRIKEVLRLFQAASSSTPSFI